MGFLDEALSVARTEGMAEGLEGASARAAELGLPDVDLGMYDAMRYFGLGTDDMVGQDYERVMEIYGWAKELGDPLKVIRKTDIALGKPPIGKIEKLWAHMKLESELAMSQAETKAIKKKLNELKHNS